ncbi:PSD1 and planctomycete cytochrome C domain-containing protein [Schlesneria paludicola]|uniref:PSD1 and planctomycete cytochrome C domain-containing protein n=1 Tax=Schlesneria paludicola TaxID=360056 RepID=UPI00029ACFBF|nr:PSD1 and planctomycete cytochrome C domain-containing protein [Schlesneria paludicola]
MFNPLALAFTHSQMIRRCRDERHRVAATAVSGHRRFETRDPQRGGEAFLRDSILLTVALIVSTLPVQAADSIEYNRDIRPILSENCFYCHGQDGNKRQADLRLDQRDAAIQAKAIIPHDTANSSIVRRILSGDPDEQMPPPKSNRRLSPEQKELLQRWIAEGAKYQTHWAFVTPVRPAEPSVKNEKWSRNPIDRFVLGKLEATELEPSPEADRAKLIRRLSIDLLGLPPTPAEVDAFLADPDPLAYETLVDRMLQNEHYGERMALPWLDAARYADSNGFQQDGDTWQWMWRDELVRALNQDQPFDQFTIWQLAGDLLPNATTEQKLASGFNRNHLLNGEGGAIAEEQRFVNLFDRVDTTATTWLGLTMACSQCHDHKYDPLTMQDYYGLLDAFNRVPETGTPQRMSSRIRVAAPFLELLTDENRRQIAEYESRIKQLDEQAAPLANAAYEGWRQGIAADTNPADVTGLPASVVTLLQKPEGERTEDEKKQVEAELRSLFDKQVRPGLNSKIPILGQLDATRKQFADYKGDQIPRPMIMSDGQPRETAILDRGEYLKPKDKVAFNTPAFLPPLADGLPRNRLGFAQWLIAPENPLMARVQVNRMWQHFFETGLVKTAEDFGVQSEYPLHRSLLDWLAVEFRERGWSMKHIHRLIVTSTTYRQSSRLSPALRAADPENRLFARASRFRMPAMLLRDWALSASSLLNERLGGAPVYPYQPAGIWEPLAITKERDFTYPASSGSDLYRRSIYTFWRRTVGPANMFDASNRQTCRVRLAATSTPLHALTTLNDPTWVEAARVLAEHGMKSASDLEARLTAIFRRVIGRPVTQSDLAYLTKAFNRQAAIYRQEPELAKELLSVGTAKRDESLDLTDHAALTAVCRMILNLDEALTRE